jgi:hypothetical protein
MACGILIAAIACVYREEIPELPLAEVPREEEKRRDCPLRKRRKTKPKCNGVFRLTFV